MTHLLRPSLLLAWCALLAVWPGAVASGSEAHASGPLSSGPPAAAAPPAPAPDDASPFSLTVTPTRLVVGPDDIGDEQRVRVKNGGDAPVTVEVQKRSFSPRPDGTLAFEEEAPYSAAAWLTLDATSLVIAPGQSAFVTATITVPPSPEPGDHQAALVFLVPSGETEDNVRINRGIAVPAFITVPGPADDSVSLGELDVDGFSMGGPLTISTEIRSTGTVHHDFRGSAPLEVHGSGGRLAFADFTVLRGATRQITASWDPPLFCICHPSVRVTDADGTVQTRTVRVVVLPLPLIGGVLAGLLVLDPIAAGRMEPGNRRRVVRALEVTLGSGRPFSSYGPGLSAHPATPFTLVGLARSTDDLGTRIEARYADQLAAGLVDEVRALRDHPNGLSRTAAQALGYKELLEHLQGEVTLEAAVDLAVRRTRRFARRQRAWFRRDPRIRWIDAAPGSSSDENALVDQLAALVG